MQENCSNYNNYKIHDHPRKTVWANKMREIRRIRSELNAIGACVLCSRWECSSMIPKLIYTIKLHKHWKTYYIRISVLCVWLLSDLIIWFLYIRSIEYATQTAMLFANLPAQPASSLWMSRIRFGLFAFHRLLLWAPMWANMIVKFVAELVDNVPLTRTHTFH